MSAFIVAFIAALANLSYVMMTFVTWLALGFATNLIAAASVGLVWHSFAYRRNWRSVQTYVVPGLLVGIAIPFALFVLPPLLGGSGLDQVGVGFIFAIAAVIGMALGGFTALFAWLIRRPDRDAPNPDRAAP